MLWCLDKRTLKTEMPNAQRYCSCALVYTLLNLTGCNRHRPAALSDIVESEPCHILRERYSCARRRSPLWGLRGAYPQEKLAHFLSSGRFQRCRAFLALGVPVRARREEQLDDARVIGGVSLRVALRGGQ